MKVSTLLPNLNLPGIFGLTLLVLIGCDVFAIVKFFEPTETLLALPWVVGFSAAIIVVGRKAWTTLRSPAKVTMAETDSER